MRKIVQSPEGWNYLQGDPHMSQWLVEAHDISHDSNVDNRLCSLIEPGTVVIDAGAHTVTLGGKSLHLTPTEFDLLLFMARNAGKALTHRALLTAVWGGQSAHQPEYLRVFIGQLRRKLEAEGPRQYIQTEPWVGYRFLPEGVPE